MSAECAAHWATQAGVIQSMQVALYVMCGGGLLGKSAAEQPGSFYIDERCGRLPYGRRAVKGAVRQLVALAKASGLDPNNLPPMPRFPNCEAF